MPAVVSSARKMDRRNVNKRSSPATKAKNNSETTDPFMNDDFPDFGADDEALFAVDVTGDKAVINRERLGKSLRSDEILQLKSAAEPISGRAHINSKLGPGIINKKKKGALPASEIRRLKRIAENNGLRIAAPKKGHADKISDVWDTPEPEITSEWIEPKRSKLPPVTFGQAPVVLTENNQPLPHVEVADAGQSYNPPVAEWQRLIEAKAKIQAELDAEKELYSKSKNRAAYAEDERFDTITADPLPDDDNDNDDSQVDGILVNPNHKPTRKTAKTRTERNKLRRRKAQLKLEQDIRARKAERKAFHELLAKANTMSETTTLSDDDHQMSTIEPQDNTVPVLRRRKFGKHPIAPDPLEIHLSEDLAESLRTLKTEGNLFVDRYRSLVKRGVIESRVLQKKRRRYEWKRWER